jgi:intracellular multiplication protein IcmB
MSMFVNFIDSILSWSSRMSNESASSFCEIETVDSDRKTLISADGSMASIIELKGSSRLVGEDEYNDIVTRLSNTLDSFMKNPGHSIQVYWIRDPDGAADVVRMALEGPREQSRRLKMDFEDIMDEKEREIAKWVCHEAVYFVLWTHKGVLSPAEFKAAVAEKNKKNKTIENFDFLDAQNPRKLTAALRNHQSAFVSSVLAEMRELNLVAYEMNGHEGLRAMRYSVDPNWTPRSWKPIIPGDRIPTKFPMRANEASAVWWPPIGSQVFPRDAITFDSTYVQIGDRVHAPMYVEIPQSRSEPFQKLIKRAIDLDKKMPFTVSFILRGGGMRTQVLKKTLSSVLAVMSTYNPQIKDCLNGLSVLEQSESIISLQMAFNTWAPVGEEALLRQRASRMAQAMIDWGGCEVRQVTGDPLEGFSSTALGLTPKSIAAVAAVPLMDVTPLLPLTRPASPWSTGAELFTSPDGKLMPYQPGSSLQSTWISIFIGGPGSGKSMQMFKQHLATILAPSGGVDKLPQIAIIDIGPSSSGLSSMLKTSLPKDMQHYVNHYRVRNTVEFAFNPFDPHLGMDGPLPEDRSFLVDLLTMLATPAETGKAYEGTAELAGLIIDEMYAVLANDDRGNPRQYYPTVDADVDKAIELASITLPENVSWYEVRDLLFVAGNTHAANLAQRYAVPILSDAASAARSPSVRDSYSKKLTAGEGSETLPEAFSRMITAACREYKVLSQPTRFDIGESRVTILDLDEVAKSGGPAGAKQTSIMYGLSLFMLARNFTMTQANLRDIPEMYRNYHYAKVQSVSKEMKTICCDEFHRTQQGFSNVLRERIKVYAREGRKWNIQLMLGSQRLVDFDQELIDMATGVFIMEKPDGTLLEEYTKRFSLSPTESYALANSLHTPRAGGGCFFVRMKMKSGYYNQLLKNPAGPIELWAGATTAEDKSIRETVYATLGAAKGRAALAAAYPGGSAKEDADNRKEMMIMKGQSNKREDDVFDTIAKEIIIKYQNKHEEETQALIERQRAADTKRADIEESIRKSSE